MVVVELERTGARATRRRFVSAVGKVAAFLALSSIFFGTSGRTEKEVEAISALDETEYVIINNWVLTTKDLNG